MAQKKTLHAREAELQGLLATDTGKKELERLAAVYESASGRHRPEGRSIITYLIVHEREKGLIEG